jgi:hypothetical protein
LKVRFLHELERKEEEKERVSAESRLPHQVWSTNRVINALRVKKMNVDNA